MIIGNVEQKTARKVALQAVLPVEIDFLGYEVRVLEWDGIIGADGQAFLNAALQGRQWNVSLEDGTLKLIANR